MIVLIVLLSFFAGALVGFFLGTGLSAWALAEYVRRGRMQWRGRRYQIKEI